jgi:hypothetical protein
MEIAHASEYLLGLVRQGPVPMKETPLTVT